MHQGPGHDPKLPSLVIIHTKQLTKRGGDYMECNSCEYFRGLDDTGVSKCAYVGCSIQRRFQCDVADERDISVQNEHTNDPAF
jgi:hypothetical protein